MSYLADHQDNGMLNKDKKQAGAEQCQAQQSLSYLPLATNQLGASYLPAGS